MMHTLNEGGDILSFEVHKLFKALAINWILFLSLNLRSLYPILICYI
jgi:hypothetical protein